MKKHQIYCLMERKRLGQAHLQMFTNQQIINTKKFLLGQREKGKEYRSGFRVNFGKS